MAKSKIIKDLVSDKITINQAMDRLLVICMEIGDANTIQWIKNEKDGYDGSEIKKYRITRVQAIGDYELISLGQRCIYQNRILPTMGVDEDMIKKWNEFFIRWGINSLQEQKKALDSGKFGGIPIPPEMFFMFEKNTNIQVTKAFLYVSPQSIGNILDRIKMLLIEILVTYEKNFGNLDDFDIDLKDYDVDEIEKFKKVTNSILNGKNSGNIIVINNSKIKNSNIGSGNKIEKKTELTTDITIPKNQNKTNIFKWLFNKIFKGK